MREQRDASLDAYRWIQSIVFWHRMGLIGWYVIVPFSLGALVVGLIQSLGTEWGLFRHYWVLVKFLLTIAAIALLLLHMQLVSYLGVGYAALHPRRSGRSA